MANGRQQLTPAEIAETLDYYDLGGIEKVKEFPRGSRKAPKYLVFGGKGKFLLKRRAPGKDDPFKVAFAHQLQWHLAQRDFPLPHLIGTKEDHNSMLQLNGCIYEVFEYIDGHVYDQSEAATGDGGDALGRYHCVLEDFECQWQPSRGSYHNTDAVRQALRRVPKRLAGHDSVVGNVDDMVNIVEFLTAAYERAAAAAEDLGIAHWPSQIVHCDWHPGNLLYRDSRVVAVIDYDAARLLQRVTDLSNGALQFSIIGGERNDPESWPDHFDEKRLASFLRGYDEQAVISAGEIRAVPQLMMQALIAECVLPIAITGEFGRMPGYYVLRMVRRKTVWLQNNAQRIVGLLS